MFAVWEHEGDIRQLIRLLKWLKDLDKGVKRKIDEKEPKSNVKEVEYRLRN